MNALKETKKKHLLAILKYLYLHNSSTMNELVENSIPNSEVSTMRLVMNIVYQAIPFIIIEGGINLYQLIDQLVHNLE